MDIDIKDCEDLEVDGINFIDFPDFVDAYFSDGYHVILNRDLTDDELDQLTIDHPDIVHEKVQEKIY